VNRVILVCKTDRFDTTPAARFGEVTFLVGKNASPFAPDDFVIEVLEGLERIAFDPINDYFALTGPAAQLAMGYAIAMRKYGKLRTLIFDARTDSYVTRNVEVLT
jgi:hypothetical protein